MDSESDFYGDDEEVDELESRVADSKPGTYWKNRIVPTMASPAIKAEESTPSPITAPAQLYNPYEGKVSCAKQLNESMDTFLARLPPATTDADLEIPWIYVANPFIPRDSRGGEEAPAEFGARLGQFVEGGEKRLEMLGDHQRGAKDIAATAAAKGRAGATKAALERELRVEREECVNDILMLARMMKPGVDRERTHLPRATVKNELGIAAKVAPRRERGSTTPRLICIYTYDFADRDDVARVLARLRQLDLVRTGSGPRQIFYKADAYTYLGIAGGNSWGLKASLYGSNEIFAHVKDKSGKIVPPAQKRKAEAGEESQASRKVKVKKEKEDDDEEGQPLRKVELKKEKSDDDGAWVF